MRTKFWQEKSTAPKKRSASPRKSKKIDVSKLTPSQKQALAAALMGENNG